MEASILLGTALRAALFAAVDYLEDDPDSMDQDPPATYTPSKVNTLHISVEQQVIWAASVHVWQRCSVTLMLQQFVMSTLSAEHASEDTPSIQIKLCT